MDGGADRHDALEPGRGDSSADPSRRRRDLEDEFRALLRGQPAEEEHDGSIARGGAAPTPEEALVRRSLERRGVDAQRDLVNRRRQVPCGYLYPFARRGDVQGRRGARPRPAQLDRDMRTGHDGGGPGKLQRRLQHRQL